MDLHGFNRRKITKTTTIKTVAHRDEQFVKIDSLVNTYQSEGCPVLSMDNCRHYLFKEAIHKFAQKTGLEVSVAHYPAYCSKYTPIEHRVFPYITKAFNGVMIDSAETVKELIEQRAKTKTGLKVFAKIITKHYEKGKKAAKDFLLYWMMPYHCGIISACQISKLGN